MAPDSEGDDLKEAVSSQPLSGETTPSPSLSSSSGDLLHAPPLPALPLDLGIEILSKLPVKFLLQLRCVCKSWNSLISDPKFAKKHLRESQARFTRHHLILGRRDSDYDSDSGEFLLWDSSLPSVFKSESTCIPETQFSYPLNNGDRYVSIVGSCDGILCLDPCNDDDDGNSFFVWNPSIRKFKILPPLKNHQPRGYTVYGFGYDHFTDNYKVVAVFCYQHDRQNRVCKTQVKVHTLGTDSWRRIRDFPSVVPVNESGKFVSGTVNWSASAASNSSWVIVSLDLGKESYQEILQPDYGGAAVRFLTLGVLRDCLCILFHGDAFFDVWVMKDYGIKESWTKLFAVPYMELLGCSAQALATALYISEDDQVLLDFVDEVAVYNSRNGTLKIPKIQYIFSDLFVSQVYVESLISPCP